MTHHIAYLAALRGMKCEFMGKNKIGILEVCRLLGSSCSITACSRSMGWFDDFTIRYLFDYIFCKSSSQPGRRIVCFLCTIPCPYTRKSVHHRSLPARLLCSSFKDKEKGRSGYFWTVLVGQTSAVLGNDSLNPRAHKLERLDSKQHFWGWISKSIANYRGVVH